MHRFTKEQMCMLPRLRIDNARMHEIPLMRCARNGSCMKGCQTTRAGRSEEEWDAAFCVSPVILFLFVCPHTLTSPRIGPPVLQSCDLRRSKHMKKDGATKMAIFPFYGYCCCLRARKEETLIPTCSSQGADLPPHRHSLGRTGEFAVYGLKTLK